MNPTAAETDRWMPRTYNARMPPTNENGTFTNTSAASRTDANATNSSAKTMRIVIGRITARRARARARFSNWPPHVMWYPDGSGTDVVTSACASATNPP